MEAGGGRLGATFVRRFGRFSATTVREENEIEAVAVDDALGYVYYADEADGIHKWHADPDHADAARELAHFARSGFRGDREGIAIYTLPDGTGYVVATDQLDERQRVPHLSARGCSRATRTITRERSPCFAAAPTQLMGSRSRRARSGPACRVVRSSP